MRLVIFCKSYVYLSFIEDNSKKPTIVLTWYFNRGESGLLKFRCFFSLQSFRLGTEGITYKFIGICYFSACVTRHQKWHCGTCPQIHNKTSCKSCHDGLSARNGYRFHVESPSNSVPLTPVFCLPFFAMEIPWVSIDAAEFADTVFKTAARKTRNGRVNS